MNKYEGYEYNVETCAEEIDNSCWTGTKPEEKIMYVYTVFAEHTDYDSDEWYHTEEEAHEAAKRHINTFFDGPDEPDYDAPTFAETYRKAWEQDQDLKGRGW